MYRFPTPALLALIASLTPSTPAQERLTDQVEDLLRLAEAGELQGSGSTATRSPTWRAPMMP